MTEMKWAEADFDAPNAAPLKLPQPASGSTHVMYHGTTRSNAQAIVAKGFLPSADGMLGRGVYLSRDPQKASRYPLDRPESDRVVIKVAVHVGNVIAIDTQGHPAQKTWRARGFDTAWVPSDCGMVKSGLEEECVWDPDRIDVIGTMDPITA